jgi:glycosyltransferase involved in cell wall biosynthesis
MSVAVIIPALNEEGAVGQVVAQVPQPPVDEIIVVDNASIDGTAAEAAQAGAHVISEERRGYGQACYAGAREAKSEILVFLDADGTFDPAEIRELIKPIQKEGANLVLGSRELGEGGKEAVLPHQRFGNLLAVRLLRWLYGQRFTDLGPFRAIRV